MNRSELLGFWKWRPESPGGRKLLSFTYIAGALGMISLAGRYALPIFLSYGLPPCGSDGWRTGIQMGLALSLLFGSAILSVATRNPGMRHLMIALTPLILIWPLFLWASMDDARRQAACKAWTVEEAMVACRANPAVYRIATRRSFDDVSMTSLRLEAPGTADDAWSCLNRWSDSADSGVSIEVDESVYEATRIPTRKTGK